MFNRFKVQIADEFPAAQVKKIAQYFDLPLAKRSEILESTKPAVSLLTALEDDRIIGEDVGVKELCEAFEFCSLNRLARIAEDSYTKEKERGNDLPDGPVVDTKIGPEELKKTLQNEMTRQQCIDVAMFLAVPVPDLESIDSDKKPGERLFKILFDRNLIGDSNVGILVVALKNRGIDRVATLIANAGTGQRRSNNESTAWASAGSSLASQSSDSSVELSTCICGEEQFDELKLENGKLVCVECQECSNVWIAGAEASQDAIMLRYNGDAFFYRTPLQMVLDLSKISHEIVTDASHLKRGDHLVFRRGMIMYDHHAILVADVVQNNMHVVHWTAKLMGAATAAILGRKKVNIENEKIPFPGKVIRVKYPIEDDPDLVVARAHKLYQKRGEQNYSLTENNCETLATHCKIGKGFSIQGEALKRAPKKLLAKGVRLLTGL